MTTTTQPLSTTFTAFMVEVSPPRKPVSDDGMYTASTEVRLVTTEQYSHEDLIALIRRSGRVRVTIEEVEE